jgi:hypothetical protein
MYCMCNGMIESCMTLVIVYVIIIIRMNVVDNLNSV